MAESFRILSVEDDEGLYKLLQVTLRPLPVVLSHAKTGTEALAMIPQVNPHLLILDITLPDMRGWQVLDQMSVDKTILKGVIVLTGRTETTHRVIARLQEVTAYVTKPFKPAELRRMVQEIVEKTAVTMASH
ncbi:MAG: response regulator [Anaerolineae bacterium]